MISFRTHRHKLEIPSPKCSSLKVILVELDAEHVSCFIVCLFYGKKTKHQSNSQHLMKSNLIFF